MMRRRRRGRWSLQLMCPSGPHQSPSVRPSLPSRRRLLPNRFPMQIVEKRRRRRRQRRHTHTDKEEEEEGQKRRLLRGASSSPSVAIADAD